MERIFRIWPTLADLADDLGKPYTTVASWRARGSIPAKHYLALVRAAESRGHTVTVQELAEATAESQSSGVGEAARCADYELSDQSEQKGAA